MFELITSSGVRRWCAEHRTLHVSKKCVKLGRSRKAAMSLSAFTKPFTRASLRYAAKDHHTTVFEKIPRKLLI
jgi:hypothetical protein